MAKSKATTIPATQQNQTIPAQIAVVEAVNKLERVQGYIGSVHGILGLLAECDGAQSYVDLSDTANGFSLILASAGKVIQEVHDSLNKLTIDGKTGHVIGIKA